MQAVQPQPQARSSIQEAPVSPQSAIPPQSAAPAPQSPVMSQSSPPQSAVSPQPASPPPQSPVVSQSSVPVIPVESHMVQTQPTEEEEAELNNVEDTGYSAIALYDYQAGWISPDV